MARTPALSALIIATSLLAAFPGASSMAATSSDTTDSVEATVEKMARREGVSKADLENLSNELLQAYQLQQPGDYFDKHSPGRIAVLAQLYGLTDLAHALSQWDLSRTDQSRSDISPGASGQNTQEANRPSRQVATADARTRTTAAGSDDPVSRAREQAVGESDNEFVARLIGQMSNRESISRDEVNRFESILLQDRAPQALRRHGPENVAELASIYGLDNLASTLQRRERNATGAMSAADRIASVTSEPSDSDYRDEYLAEANSYDVTGVARYSGAQLTVFSEDLVAYTLDDPIAGQQMRNNVTSCLYNGTAPRKRSPQATNTMQHLELHQTITAARFIPATGPEDTDTTVNYQMSKVALDWGEASASRVPAYFYGYQVPKRQIRYDEWGRETYVTPPPPPPEWHRFSCSPRSIRS